MKKSCVLTVRWQCAWTSVYKRQTRSRRRSSSSIHFPFLSSLLLLLVVLASSEVSSFILIPSVSIAARGRPVRHDVPPVPSTLRSTDLPIKPSLQIRATMRRVQVSTTLSFSSSSSPSSSSTGAGRSATTEECAALLPAQVVQIRVGDVSLARKAWKKRRRSGSPLLIPATILGLDKESLVRHNVMTILHKYGNPIKPTSYNNNLASLELPRNGVALSVAKVCKLCERDFGLSLLQSSKDLGYYGVGELLISLFDGEVKNAYGMEVVTGLRDNLLLVSKVSRRQARELAAKACLAHVSSPSDATTSSFSLGLGKGRNPSANYVVHLGTVKVRQEQQKQQSKAGGTIGADKLPIFSIEPLSAAVRIKQEDFLDNRIQSGQEIKAFIFGFDPNGDNGSPLLTLAMDKPPRMTKRAQRRQQQDAQSHTGDGKQGNIDKDLAALRVGDGPIKATIIAVSSRAGAAFVDCGVGRERSKRLGGGTTRVLGMLRFDDLVQDVVDTGAEQDVVGGETKGTDWEVGNDDDESQEESLVVEDLPLFDFVEEWEQASEVDEEHNDDGDDENEFFALSPEERLLEIGMMLEAEEIMMEHEGKFLDPVFLRVGDEVEVYVKAISQQSGRFMVTLDASVKDKKAKDIKMEKVAQQRMSKLADKMGGGDGLATILELVGTECAGIVKAASKTGSWYYVQPILDGEDKDDGIYSLPVGIARHNVSQTDTQLSPGGKVRIRLEGIDETRGQLAMTLLK